MRPWSGPPARSSSGRCAARRSKSNLNDPQPQPETVSIEVRYLADCPESARSLALWLYEEWGRRNPDNSVEKVEKRLMQRMNRHKVPLTLVALQGSEPVGSASLIIREMETHPQFLHWLGGVYIHHPYRNQGIGSQLVEYAASEAERLGVRELYLYTRHHVSFYSRLGWRPVGRAHYHGREVLIMKRVLTARQLAGANPRNGESSVTRKSCRGD
jgi:predicted N-acetyltransferase YhbS